MNREAWRATGHKVTKSQTQLKRLTHTHMHACTHKEDNVQNKEKCKLHAGMES